VQAESKGEIRAFSTGSRKTRFARWSPLLAVAAAAALWIGLIKGPSRVPSLGVPSADSAEMRLKGALGLAVIRERDGQQERFTGTVSVRPFDRLRAAVQVGIAIPLSVAFIGEDGTFIDLLSSGRAEPGEHYSETAIHMDEHPTAGRIVAGTSDAVERARREGRFEAVTVLRVEVEH
jgi:hypothetical protein